MLSFLFSTSKELGYSETIRRHRDSGGRLCYVYKIGTSFYRTIDPIDDHQSGRLGGRVTRVWKAIKILSADNLASDPDAAEVVIRDVWLQADAKTEPELQEGIYASLRKVADLLEHEARLENPAMDDSIRMIARIKAAKSLLDWEDALKCVKDGHYSDYFLQIGGHGFGAETKTTVADVVADPDIFKETNTPTVQSARLPGANRSSVSTRTSNQGHNAPPLPQVQRTFSSRKRHFLVYTEVCEALQSLTDYGDVVKGLGDAIMGKWGSVESFNDSRSITDVVLTANSVETAFSCWLGSSRHQRR